MSELSNAPAETARKMQTLILKQLQEPGRAVAISTITGISESAVSRIKNDHLENICQILAHAGLKVVPSDSYTISPDKLHALAVLACDTFESPDDLIKVLLKGGGDG